MNKLRSVLLVLTMLILVNNGYAVSSSMSSKFNKEYELIFVYSSTCGYCKKFAPIFKQWVNDNNLNVRAVTANGGTLPGFKNAKSDPNVLSRFNITGLPTIVIAKKSDGSGTIFSEGSMSVDKLDSRFNSYLQDLYSE